VQRYYQESWAGETDGLLRRSWAKKRDWAAGLLSRLSKHFELRRGIEKVVLEAILNMI
jgi:hypothetical protein